MFQELIKPLRDAWNERPEDAVHVISRHRSKADVSDDWAACNLREPFLDILKRAGVKPWTKLFHAMRAACETDLVDAGYPIQAVTAWMGYSTKIVEKHYLRVRKEYFERAVQSGSMLENSADTTEKEVQKAV